MSEAIDNFNDYLESIKAFERKLRDDEILCFRGSSNAANGNRPGIDWQTNVEESSAYHGLMIEFPEEFDCKRDHLGTLAKMQHYGLPTRMFDVSGNILVSLYFAVSGDKGKDGCVEIYKVRKSEILKHNSDRALMLSCLPRFDKKTQDSIRSFCNRNKGKIDECMIKGNDAMTRFLHEVRGEYPAFECAIIGEDLLESYFVRANKNSQRMKVQDGYFIIRGLDGSRFDSLISSHRVGKLTIKSVGKGGLLSDLNMMGVRDDIVYPGLERTALYLRSKKLCRKDLGD